MPACVYSCLSWAVNQAWAGSAVSSCPPADYPHACCSSSVHLFFGSVFHFHLCFALKVLLIVGLLQQLVHLPLPSRKHPHQPEATFPGRLLAFYAPTRQKMMPKSTHRQGSLVTREPVPASPVPRHKIAASVTPARGSVTTTVRHPYHLSQPCQTRPDSCASGLWNVVPSLSFPGEKELIQSEVADSHAQGIAGPDLMDHCHRPLWTRASVVEVNEVQVGVEVQR